MATQTVKQFVRDAYQIISASTPTIPLQGDDQSKGVQFLNELLASYSSSSLRLTIAKKISFSVIAGQSTVTFGAASYSPTPDVTEGRLSNLENAWLELSGVTYPLIDESRNVFFGSYKYEPQLGLPRFVIITNEVDLTTMQLYPAPSQGYTVYVYGKFELTELGINDDMSSLPLYYSRFLKMALARDLAVYKGRLSGWNDQYEARYQEYKDEMESVSSMNITIDSTNESYLNGAWRIRAGI